MKTQEKIEKVLLNDKALYTEFLFCLYHKGLAEITYRYQDDRNFYFQRKAEQFGINDVFISFTESCFFDSTIRQLQDANVITIITPNRPMSFRDYEIDWKISIRKQFSKHTIESGLTSTDLTLLNSNHKDMIQTSQSETSKQNYELSLEFGDSCYAIISDNQLISFASVGKLEQAKLAEINWIYTEENYRRQGYGHRLLQGIINELVSDGYLVTYHCVLENEASARTAIHGGMGFELERK